MQSAVKSSVTCVCSGFMVRVSRTTAAAVVPPEQPTIAGRAWSNQHSLEKQPEDPGRDSSFGEHKLFFGQHFSSYPPAVASSGQRNASSAVYQVSDPEIELESRQSAASYSQRNAYQVSDPETEFESRRSSRCAAKHRVPSRQKRSWLINVVQERVPGSGVKAQQSGDA
jgi:hypothetical protein